MKVRFLYMLAIVVSCMIVSCSDNSYEDYMTVIPKDAKGVAAVRFDNIVNKSGVARSPLIRLVLSKMGSAMGADVEAKVKELIHDPSLSGIDFSRPAYVFAINDKMFGLTMKVEDQSLLNELMGTLVKLDFCSKVKESDGYQWTSLADGSARMVYSDNTLLIVLANTGIANTLNPMMLAMMRQNADDSFVTTPQFAKLRDQKYEDLQVYFNLGVEGVLQADMLKELLPKGAKPADYEFVSGVNLREGGVDIQGQLFSTDEKAQAEFDNCFASFKPMTGEYVNKIPKGTKLWACMGANGEQLVDLLERVPKIKEVLLAAGFVVDAEQMLRSIDGDVMICANPDKEEVAVYAQLAQSDFMNDVDSWIDAAPKYDVTITDEGQGQYHLKGSEVDAYWGVNDNQLYVGNVAYTPLSVQGTNKHADDMEGALFYILADLNAIDHMVANSVIVKSYKPGEVIINVDIDSFPGILWKGLE